MANHRNCGCGRPIGCLNSVRGARWDNYPYYNGECPDAQGEYVRAANHDDDDCACRRPRRHHCRFGLFQANAPMVVAANGVIPLVNSYGCGRDFCVGSGQIAVEEAGTYLATYTARAPETLAADTTITLNVNEVSQPSAVAVLAAGEDVTGQTIFTAGENCMVSLRSSEAMTSTEPSLQPVFTLSLVKLD